MPEETGRLKPRHSSNLQTKTGHRFRWPVTQLKRFQYLLAKIVVPLPDGRGSEMLELSGEVDYTNLCNQVLAGFRAPGLNLAKTLGGKRPVAIG